jgi:hypothetical protein
VFIEVNLADRLTTGNAVVIGTDVQYMCGSMLPPGSMADDELAVRLPFALIQKAVATYYETFDPEGRMYADAETTNTVNQEPRKD